ncbi:MAG: DUF805 domain-containing protein [Candidatus Kapaibacteriales bacterium]
MEYLIDPLKNMFNFSGRMARKPFWIFTLIVILAPSLMLTAIFDFGLFTFFILGPIYLILTIASLSSGIRRLHDIGKSGVNILFGLIPVIGIVILIYFYIQEGQPTANQWGEPPTEGPTEMQSINH